MVTDLLFWIIFGAIVGWLASVLTDTNDQQGFVGNVVVGIIGALLGGMISRALGGPAVSGFNLSSIAVATVGAIILLIFVNLFRRGATSS